jgi:hypothetical protein
METNTTLHNLVWTVDARDGLGVIIVLGRGTYAFADLTIEHVKAIIRALSDGALALSDEAPIPCRAKFVRGRLVALGHASEQRWAIFEVEPVVRAVGSVGDMVR